MSDLIRRFAALKAKVGGNREKTGFEWSFGAAPEELARITPANRAIVRILSEIDFAVKLSLERGGEFDALADRAVAVLEKCMEENGVLTYAACGEAERSLLGASDAAKEYEILFASHAHIDMNWMWGWQETVAVALATFRTILDLMREYPDFTFSQSQASVYRIVEEHDPEMMEEISRRIAEGRWEVTASAWVETDKNMPDTESLIRHIRETRDYLRDVWKIDPAGVKVDFSPDTFGHSAFVPEINSFGNVRYYYHCRGLKDDLTLYRYRAPSGSEVLVYREPYWYNSGVTPDCGTGIFELSRRCGGLKCGLVVYGVGDHGGGPTRRDVERILEMREWPVFPRLRFGTLPEFFRRAEEVYDRLPVVDHELNAIFAGCYTTQSRIKLGNRRSETALLDAEKLSALAARTIGTRYPAQSLHAAWRDVLFTHFHDILTGSCVQESREYAMGLYAKALAHAQTASSKAMAALSRNVDTSAFASGADQDIRFTQSEGAGAGYGLSNYAGVPNPERGAGRTRVYTVFNTSSSRRLENAELTVWDYTGDVSRLEATGADGGKLPFQLLDPVPEKYWDHRFFRVLVQADVPALGWTTLALRERPVEDYPTYYLSSDRVERPQGPVVLENEKLRAEFSAHSGFLTSLTDKVSGRELLSGPAGLTLTRMSSNDMSAWKIGRHMKSFPVDDMDSLEELPKGELRQGFAARYNVLGSTARVTVTLDKGSPVLAWQFEIDWREYSKEGEDAPLLLLTVPVRARCESILTDVPAGAAVRKAQYMDVPALSFAAAVSDEPAPALLCDCKYGYRLCGNTLSLTLINTSHNPDPYPERGVHAIKAWLGAAPADAKAAKAMSEALMRPLAAVPTAVHEGLLPPCGELMGFESDSAVLSSVTLSDGGDLDARVYETCGKETGVALSLPFEPASAELVDLDGNRVGDACVDGRAVTFRVAPHKIAQVRVKG